MRWALAVCAALSGCGRYAFDRQLDAAGPQGSDAGPADAGPADAGPGDAVDASPMADAFDAGAACAGFALCDSFEGATFDPMWTVGTNVSIDTMHAHRGTHSVHVHVPALAVNQEAYSQLGERTTLAGATPPVTFYVRAWFLLGARPAGANHMEAISIEPATSAPVADYSFVYADDVALYAQGSDATRLAGVAAPVNTWFCLVMKVVRDPSAGQLTLTSDVVPTISLTAQTDATATPIRVISFGAGFSGTNVVDPQPALDLWFDDVIVDPQPVTCAD